MVNSVDFGSFKPLTLLGFFVLVPLRLAGFLALELFRLPDFFLVDLKFKIQENINSQMS